MKANIVVPFLFIVVAIAAMEVQGTVEDNEPVASNPVASIVEEFGDGVKEFGDGVKEFKQEVQGQVEEVQGQVEEVQGQVEEVQGQVEEVQDVINKVTDPNAVKDAVKEEVEEVQQEVQDAVKGEVEEVQDAVKGEVEEVQDAVEEEVTEVQDALRKASERLGDAADNIFGYPDHAGLAQEQREKPTGAIWIAGGFFGLGLISLVAIKVISWNLNSQRRTGRKDVSVLNTKTQHGAQEKEPQWRL